MGVYLRHAALRDARLCDLQQNARGEIPLDSDQDGTIDAKKTDLQAEEPVCYALFVCAELAGHQTFGEAEKRRTISSRRKKENQESKGDKK